MEPIKRFFAGASFLVFGFALHAANPAYESFKGTNGQVVTTPGVGAARIVVISGQNFQPGSTNLTNWANLSTNVVSGANIWTQSGGTAFPTSAGAIVATNVQSWDKLIAKGAFIAETRSRTLVAGTNTLAVLTNSYLLLDSPTNDASSVVVQIGSAASLGQLLFVVNNQTNRAFTIYDGSVSGSGIVELQGNFVSTNIGGLILMNQGNWVEVGRFSPGTLESPLIGSGVANYLTKWTGTNSLGLANIRHETNSPFNQYANQPGLIAEGIFRPDIILRTTIGLGIVQSDPTTISVLQNPGFYRLPVTNDSTTNRVFYLTNPTYLLQASDVQEILVEFMGGAGTVTLASGTNMALNSSWVPTTRGDRLALHWDSFTGKWSEQWRYPLSASSGPSFADLVWTNSGVIETLAYGTNGPYYSDDGAGSTFFRVNNSNTNGYGRAEIGTYNDGSYAEATMTLSANTNGPNSAFISVDVAQDFAQIVISFNGSYRTRIDPTAADGTTPYTFDTSLAHTSGNLNEWKNFGVTHLSLASTNGISTPAITAYGAGSAPWQFGMATNTVDTLLRATNVLEVTVGGVAYLIPATLK